MMLEGRTAMVTGIGPGMGRDISLALASEGADVILVARSDKVVPSVAEEIEAMGRKAFPVYGNIAKRDECDRIAAEALAATSTLGVDRAGLDVLVNSAFHGGDMPGVRFEDADLERWRRPVDINYFGTLQLTQSILPQLKLAAERTGDARIVMINTMSTERIQPNSGAYAASKAALKSVTKTLARELGPQGIRVNGIHPGYIWGDSVEWYFNHLATERGTTFQEVYDEVAAETCLGYLPSSEEIAGAVVFFASTKSALLGAT